MTEIGPNTAVVLESLSRDELLEVWRDFYDTPTAILPFRDPDPDAIGADGWADRVILAGLQRAVCRAITRDRARRVQEEK